MTTSHPGSDAAASQCAVQLRTAILQLARRLRANLQRDGLSAAKLSVLGQIARAGSLTPTDLAAREGVKLQSLTRLLAELEAEGWLLRQPHPADARQSVLSLTPDGLARLTATVRDGDHALAQAIDRTLSAEQQHQLLQACVLLDRLSEALDSAGGEA